MRERSHKKGWDYQRATKKWLLERPFLGLDTAGFGDAYDASSKATQLGTISFDFSLQLRQENEVKRILYAECKYRTEKGGNVNDEFHEFLKRVHAAYLNCSADEIDAAELCFISNVPPDDWRAFLRNKQQYCVKHLGGLSAKSLNRIIEEMVHHIHILVLSRQIIGR